MSQSNGTHTSIQNYNNAHSLKAKKLLERYLEVSLILFILYLLNSSSWGIPWILDKLKEKLLFKLWNVLLDLVTSKHNACI